MSTISTLRRRQQTRRPWEDLPSVGLDRKIRKCIELDLSVLRRRPTYGPAYRGEQFSNEMKEKAWMHLVERTEGTEEEIRNQFISAVISIESKARASYADDILTNLSVDEFRHTMVRDTCFFLQLVLSYFAANLQYHSQHPLFGIDDLDEKDLRMLMESMFIVGNQIPLVVLEKLMDQSFFRQAIEGTTKWKKPSGLLETVLYKFLLVPALSNNQHGPSLSTNLQRPLAKPCDLLHGLHLMVLDLCGISPNEIYETEEIYISIDLPADHNYRNAEKFPSAKKMSKAGIRFDNSVDNMGSRGIYFKPKTLFKSVLYLPRLVVDDNTRVLFECLKAYERTQEFRKCEVSSYLRFLRELVPTVEDAEVLASYGILQGQINKFPAIFLGELLASNDIGLSRKLHNVRLQVNGYSCSGFQTLKKSLKLGVKAAMVVQTIFCVLQYYKNPHS